LAATFLLSMHVYFGSKPDATGGRGKVSNGQFRTMPIRRPYAALVVGWSERVDSLDRTRLTIRRRGVNRQIGTVQKRCGSVRSKDVGCRQSCLAIMVVEASMSLRQHHVM
jgi:hypothetical protein